MRGLSLKQLQAVAAVARHGTVTAAAAAVGITPSAMTTRLKELEAACEVELFDRGPGGLKVNRAGEIVLGLANQVHGAVELAAGALSALKGIVSGALVIGITSTAKYYAPRLIHDFSGLYPQVDITLSVGNRLDIFDGLKRHKLDVAIMGRPPDWLDLVSEPFGDHPMIMIGPPDHPLAARTRIERSEIVGERFLLREEGSGTRLVYEEFFQGPVTRDSHFSIEIGSNETIKQGVMAGLGLALISAHTVAFEVETGRLAVLNVQGLPIMRTWYVAYHADKAVLPAMKAFRDFTLAEGAAHLPRLPDLLVGAPA
jgi:DNA-binding transcriptional LysR family regulator